MVEYGQPYSTIRVGLQQVFGKQTLVEGGGNLGHENGIVAILIGLEIARKEGMHGMPKFMGQRIHAITLVLEVEQDERGGCICAAAICTTTFTRCLIDIDPTLRKGLFKGIDVIFT